MKSSLILNCIISCIESFRISLFFFFFVERRNTVQIKKPADANTQSLNNKYNVGKFLSRLLLRTNVHSCVKLAIFGYFAHCSIRA